MASRFVQGLPKFKSNKIKHIRICENLFLWYSGHSAAAMAIKEKDPRLTFGSVVRAFRVKAGISQERLAEIAGIHRTYIGDVERGKRNISLVNMLRISKALSVPLSRIISQMEER